MILNLVMAAVYGTWAILFAVFFFWFYSKVRRMYRHIGEPSHAPFWILHERRLAAPTLLLSECLMIVMVIISLTSNEIGFALVHLVIVALLLGMSALVVHDVATFARYQRVHGPMMLTYSMTESNLPVRHRRG